MLHANPVNPDLSPKDTSPIGILDWVEAVLSDEKTMESVRADPEKIAHLKELFQTHVAGDPKLQIYPEILEHKIAQHAQGKPPRMEVG